MYVSRRSWSRFGASYNKSGGIDVARSLIGRHTSRILVVA
jgi:hypothetical protein